MRTALALTVAVSWLAPVFAPDAAGMQTAPPPTEAEVGSPPADPDDDDDAGPPAPSSPPDEPVPLQPTPPRPAKAYESGAAFSSRADTLVDAYGDRPPGVPTLAFDQIVRFALQNPLVQAAKQQVEAMQAQVQKTRFAWIPIISTEMTLMPGANIYCDELTLDDGSLEGFEFQYCRAQDDTDFNLNRISDYFSQLAEAGVRFEFRANTVIPVTTFGKLLNTKRLAHVGLDLEQLKQAQVEHETILRVHQAYTTLLLARESLAILREAYDISNKAVARVEADLGGGSDDWDAEPEDDVDPSRDPDDLFKTELARLEIDELSRQARRVEAVSLAALWALAGRAAPRGFDIEQRRQTTYALRDGILPLSHYKNEAMTHRPEAKIAAAGVEARRYQERLARANFLPDLGILLNFAVARSTAVDPEMSQLYYGNGFNYSRLTIALALRWRWDFHFKAFDLRAARAVHRSARYQREAAQLLLAQEVEQAYHELVEMKHRIAIEKEVVDLSWKLVVSAQQKDTVGGGDAEEVVKYLEKWYRKRFELAEAVQLHNQAVARLSRAVGTQLAVPPADSPEPPPSPTPAPQPRRAR